jgi:hypothetical protein
MKITFTHHKQGDREAYQARAEQNFSTGESHGDFCLTAYGQTRAAAHAHLRELAMKMVRDLEAVKRS